MAGNQMMFDRAPVLESLISYRAGRTEGGSNSNRRGDRRNPPRGSLMVMMMTMMTGNMMMASRMMPGLDITASEKTDTEYRC
jgi:hypothetical protein